MKSLLIMIIFFAGFQAAAAWDEYDCYLWCAEGNGYLKSFVGYPEQGRKVAGCSEVGTDYPLGECSVYYNERVPTENKVNDFRDPMTCPGSVLRVDELSVGEEIPLVGTRERLTYVSSRDPNRTIDYKFTLPLTETPVDPDWVSMIVGVSVAGQSYSYPYTALTDGMVFNFTWDGLNSGSLPTRGSTLAAVSIGRTYPGSFVAQPDTHLIPLGTYKAKMLGLGGLNLSGVHFYDSARKKIFYGDGNYKDVTGLTITINGSGQIEETSPTFTNYLVVDGDEAHIFDTDGLHIATRSARTGAVLKTISYDGSGRLTSVVDAYSNAITVSRPSSSVITIQAPMGQTTTLSLDGSGRVTSVQDPLSQSYLLTYGSSGLLETFEKPTGAVNTFTYDATGQLTKDEHSAGASSSFWLSILGANTREIQMTSAEGRTTTINMIGGYVYNRYVTLPGGITGGYSSYYPNSYSSTVFPSGKVTSHSVTSDPRFGWMSPYTSDSSTYANTLGTSITTSRTSSFGTTDLLSLTSQTDTLIWDSKTWTSSYVGGSTRKHTLTSPLGHIIETTFNIYDQPIETKNASFAPVTFGYDAYGRLSTVTNSARLTTYTYDLAGNVSAVEDPLGKDTLFTHDSNGRVLTQTLPDLRVLSFNYDANGNLTGVTTPSSILHALTANLYDLPASYTAPPLSSVSYVSSYSYNNDKQLTLITRPDSSTVSFGYNATSGLLTSLTTVDGTYNYTRSGPGGQISDISSPQGVTNLYSYDTDLVNTLTTQWTGVDADVHYTWTNFLTATSVVRGTNNATNSISYTYNNDRLMTVAGNLSISRTGSTGLISGTTVNNVQEVFTYDSTYGELASYQAKYSGSQIYKEEYTRNARGQITQRIVTDGATATTFDYVYDDASRLHEVYVNSTLTRTYNYDNNSNRSSLVGGSTLSGTYDDQDRLLTYGAYTFTHNMLGERTGRTESGSSTAFTYSYDGLGAMKGFTKTYASGGGTVTDTYTYLNDARGNRVQIKKGSTIQKRFIYDEQNRLIAELNTSGNILTRFVYATMNHVPDYMIKSGTRYKIIHDHLGSVLKVINTGTGAVASSFTYDEFGKILTSSVPDFQPFGWAGGIKDDVTGFIRFGARDYDPETGRWTSKDPILFGGGDANLYGYVMADPINAVDPSGLMETDSPYSGGYGWGDGARRLFNYYVRDRFNLWIRDPFAPERQPREPRQSPLDPGKGPPDPRPDRPPYPWDWHRLKNPPVPGNKSGEVCS